MERIGEYLVSRLVGEGGMGRVYEAEERLSKRRVALKVLRPEHVRDEDGRRMFTSEMQILAQLEHPNVVRSLASLEHEGQPVLVLEYLEGRTLRDLLNDKGALPWQQAVEIAAQITSALAAAHEHERPIIHRDLKPENVMVLAGETEPPTVKVMDFGIAKVLENAQGKSTQSLGTLQYMSPEQIDARAVDARTDLYALGLVLYEMLAGEPPFRSASPRELLNLQCTAEPPPFAEDIEVPAGVEELVFQLLAKAPDDRPESAAVALAALAPLRVGKRRNKTTVSVRSPRPANTGRTNTLPLPKGEMSAVTPTGTLRSTPTPPRRVDTVALLDKASAPRQVRARTGIAAIVAAALVSGLVTYGVRTHYAHARWTPKDPATQQSQPSSSQQSGSEPGNGGAFSSY